MNKKKLGDWFIHFQLVVALGAAFLIALTLFVDDDEDDLTRLTENPDDMVDPALVGAWEIPVPGGRWTLAIEPYGHYEFSNVSGSPAPSHQGTFAARGGRWLLQSVSGIQDSGTYEVSNDTVELRGNLGAVRWTRAAQVAGAASAASAVPAQAAPAVAASQLPASPAPVAAATAAPAPAPRSTAGGIPDTIDPCLLVTADEAGALFGMPATVERTTPQPHTQNDCRYRSSSGQYFAVRSSNGRGLDPAAYMARLRRNGADVGGIGDAAVQSYQEATGLVLLDFVIGTTSVGLLVAGVDPNRAQAAIIELGRQAAQRLTSTASQYDVGGVDRFVGTWRVETYSAGGGKAGPDAIVVVQANGSVELETSTMLSGTFEVEGATWRLENPLNANPLHGNYEVRGDRLTLGGAQTSAQLTRVQCGAEPQRVRPPYEISHGLTGVMRSTATLAAPVRPPESRTLAALDKQLMGLWEGEGMLGELRARVLLSIDSRGHAGFAYFPYATGRLQADNGEYTLNLDGLPSSRGTYSLAGGIRDGIIRMQEGDNALVWHPTDTSQRPVFETPLVAQCR